MVAASNVPPGLLATDPVRPEPTPEDLAETEDVRMTEEIRALAAELNHHPVEIYNWVRNHIEFVPMYGSIQGSQMTVDNQKGNAFDTSSLLIALLRASDIPARYVVGTVQIPMDKVMNWVGGVRVPEVALGVLGQGGIPHTAVVSGGAIAAVQIEHVWVEAWVDFEPSGGAIHREGDTWVPMDGAFKQYAYTEDMKISENVPFDVDTFAEEVLAAVDINEAEGSISGLSSTIMSATVLAYNLHVARI